jgi:8-oxo-dGTP pyrophosphatase MutT (NUDIX family)
MPHIHTEPGQHDHTASAYIIRTDGSEPKVMLHKHKKIGKYMHFGGHIELNETPWEAVIHELEEESGYMMSQLEILQPKERLRDTRNFSVLHPVPVSHNTHHFNDTHLHTDVAYAFITRQEPYKTVAEGESNEFILLSRQDLLDFPDEKMPEGIKDAALFVFDVCLHKWDRVDPAEFSKQF